MRTSTGFSLIELTVVLVLVSLLGSLVLPGLANAYASASTRSEMEQMKLRLGGLGYEAFSRGRSLHIRTIEDVIEHLRPPEGWEVDIKQPIEVTQIGICKSGELSFTKNELEVIVSISPPYCGNDQ